MFLMLACESSVVIELSTARHNTALVLKKVFMQVLRRAGMSAPSLVLFNDRVRLICNDFTAERTEIMNSTVLLFNNLKGFDDYSSNRPGICSRKVLNRNPYPILSTFS